MPRLRRTSPEDPGWTRRRAGAGFVYLDENGDRLSDRRAQRCKDLVIPPAWEDVWITPYDNGHLQAVGTDDAGRRQYLYHPDWRTRRDAEKYDRVLVFAKALKRAREQVLDDLGCEGMTESRACATAVRLLDLGYFRIGNDVYADEHGSFGLTTLERRHVRKQGDGLVFAFTGKSGVEHRVEIDDAGVIEAIEVMRRRRSRDDPSLLAYKNGRGWQSMVPDIVNDYVREVDRSRGDGEGLPDLARHRARGRGAGRDRRAGGDQGLPQARGRGGDEGGRRVPGQHARAGQVGVRRPTGDRGLRAGPDHPAAPLVARTTVPTSGRRPWSGPL